MKTRTIILLLMSICMVCGVVSTSMAQTGIVTENTPDSYLATVDLKSASVQTFGKVSTGVIPSWINLGIEMLAGSHLPGMIMWDMDTDHNPLTGGGSTLTMPFVTATGQTGPFKPDKGFEFYVIMTLRQQGDSSQTALCQSCSGGANQCVFMETACTGCPAGGPYYPTLNSCNIGNPNCFEFIPGTGVACTGRNCYPLINPCGFTTLDCQMGLLVGEWYVANGVGGKPFARGRIALDMGKFNCYSETTVCATLPWFDILMQAYTKGVLSVDQLNFAKDNPPKWQMSIWHDADPYDGDDMFDAGLLLNLVDFAPNSGTIVGFYNEFSSCKHNAHGGYGDVDVDSDDVTDFLGETGRGQFNKQCPGCKK